MPATARITSPFTAESTADEVIAGIDLTGRRAIVTGGASGIGVETARALAAAGAEVTLAVRDLPSGESAAGDIRTTTGNDRVLVASLELTDLESVHSFATSWDGPLHILVNNAGVIGAPEWRTPQGWELQFATNHIGHFALAVGLHGSLADAESARIISVSSNGHSLSPVVFEDIHFRSRPYDPRLAYGQSKTANVLFAIEATHRWATDGITANAVMPGVIKTNLHRHFPQEELDRMRTDLSRMTDWKTSQQGAATSVFAATSPLLNGVGGRYFENCNEALPATPGVFGGIAAHALDPEAAARLWDVSLNMIHI